MNNLELHSHYETVYALVKKSINTKSIIDNEDLIKIQKLFQADQALLLYSPAHEFMSQVSYQRLEVDSIAYLLINYNQNLGYKGEAMPEGFLDLIKEALTNSLKDKNVFDNFLLIFLSDENPLVKENARLHIQKTNLSGYAEMAKEIMLSEHFNQSHMEKILIDSLKGQKDYFNQRSIDRLFANNNYEAQSLFVKQLSLHKQDNTKFKSLINDLLLNPAHEKLIKNNAVASMLIFLSKELPVEAFKKASLNLIKEISPHINHLDSGGKSFAYYIYKNLEEEQKKTYATSLLEDFGALCISPSVTNKFMESVMGFCSIFIKSNAKPTPVKSLDASTDNSRDIKNINNAKETQKLISKLDFSKFTSDEVKAQELRQRMLEVYSISQNVLTSPFASSLDMNDIFFIKKDILENFLASTLSLTKSLALFTSIGPSDTQKIFEPWTEQLSIIENRLNKLEDELKNNLIKSQTIETNISLKVLKAKA